MSVPLHYTMDGPGDAPVLVLGSSLGTSREMWQPQMGALQGNFRVLRYDHRGHGGSPVPPGPYRLEELARDVLTLLDVLELSKVHLGGLSLGAMVATWIASQAPQRVDRLVLMSTSARVGTAEMWAERAALVRSQGIAPLADGLLERWFSPTFRARQPGVVGWARRQLVSTPAEGYASCCEALASMDLSGALPLIQAPTLVIAGSLDPATPPSAQQAVASSIPGGRFEPVAGAAHLVSVEQPDEVSRLMLEFLS